MYVCIFKFYLFIFRERGREGERKGEKHQCVVASCVLPTGDLARNPGMCPDWELNQCLFGPQVGTHSTEPYHPGLQRPYFEIRLQSCAAEVCWDHKIRLRSQDLSSGGDIFKPLQRSAKKTEKFFFSSNRIKPTEPLHESKMSMGFPVH